ncbi:MAG: hypothetical protein JXB38_03260 [Anaerolineales bacterium]|nr:hypothetical protein [Anaerolineales bacterium]
MNVSESGKTRLHPLTLVGILFNIPAILIWLTIWLRSTGSPLGESIAAWVRTNISGLVLIFLWIGLPSMALVLGMNGFVRKQNRPINVVVSVLSLILIVLIVIGISTLPESTIP